VGPTRLTSCWWTRLKIASLDLIGLPGQRPSG
jgi:hypothetical protein